MKTPSKKDKTEVSMRKESYLEAVAGEPRHYCAIIMRVMWSTSGNGRRVLIKRVYLSAQQD
jgi:hypothetical protein